MEQYDVEKRRYDYAKFVIVTEHDRIEEWHMEARVAMEALSLETGRDYSFRFTAQGQVDGLLRRYTIEFQGPAAQAVRWLDFDKWSKVVTRLDVRIPMEQTEKGLRAFRDFLDVHGTGNRRHGFSDGRVRKKTGKRDSGGKMIYIGSHRSDYRCIIYVRGSEDPAIEWLFEGPRVMDGAATIRMMRDANHEPYKSDPWGALCTHLWGRGEQELGKDIGMGSIQVAGILRGDYMPDDVVSSILARMEEQFQSLPRSAQLSLLEAIELMPLQPSREGVESDEAAS